MKKILLLIVLIGFIQFACVDDNDLTPGPNIPTSIDLRETGNFTIVKNQGSLGSCWAFACVGLAEYKIKEDLGVEVDLSEQHLVNCAEFGPMGGMEFLRDNGLTIEDSLPYQAQFQGCNIIFEPIYKVTLFEIVNVSDLGFEDRISILKGILFSEGPFVSHMDCYTDLDYYTSGIYEYDGVSDSGYGHIIVIVGYQDDDSIKNGGYWIVRNSWGSEWGENGYFKIPYDECNIAKYYAYKVSGVEKIGKIEKLLISGYHCRWSNDGSKIAYVNRNNSGIRLFVYNFETEEENVIVDDMDGDMQLSWLDEGNTIVFDAYDSNNRLDLWKVKTETGDVEFLVDNALVPDAHPQLNKMVCSKNEQLALYNKSGTLLSYIGNINGGLAVLSPDGTKVVYVTGQSGNEDIWLVNTDGTNRQQITSHEGRDYWPRWSPDGNMIAFESERSGNFDIWTYNFTTQKFVQITNHPADDRMGDWSPCGKSMVFNSKRDGDWGTYILKNVF